MKNIIIITLIFLSNSIKAQSSICPTLNSFVGEWRYVNGQDTIRIYLRTGDYTILTDGVRNTSIAMLFGWHEFKSGNTIIESNYTNGNMTLPTTYTGNHDLGFMMYCSFGNAYRLTKNEAYKEIIFNSAQTQLTWSQRSRTGFGFGTGCYGMTLPRNFVLTKQ